MRAFFLLLLLGALAAPAAERRVAITYFDINGGGEDVRPLGKGLADMLITDLLVVKGLSIVERAKLNVLMDELKLSKTPFIDPKAAVKLGKGLSATHMLTGSITVLGSKMNINARVFDVQQSKVVQSKQVEGETQEFFALEKELVDLLIEALEIKPDLKEKSALRKSQTESYEAIKGYSQGLDSLDKGDKSSAQAAFATAAKADPAWPALKSALDSLTRELDAADAKGAQSLEQKLNALRPEDPQLYEKVEALAKPRNVPDTEIDTAKRLVLTVIAKRGLKPSKERYVGHDLGGSPREYWEVVELKDYLTTDVEAIAAMPVLLEYLVRKYPDDASFLREAGRSVPNWKRDLLKADLKKPLPPPRDDWRGIRYAFANAHAQRVGLTKDPLKAMENVEALLAKEETRRAAAFRAEIKRKMAALSTTDKKVLTDQISELENNIGAWDDVDRVEATKLSVALTRWMIEHPAIRPANGTDSDPSFLELGAMQQLFVRYTADPDSWALIPPAAEYLLKKFADAPRIVSDMRLTLEQIKEAQKEPIARQREKWAREVSQNREKQAAPEVREVFKKAAEMKKKF